MQNINHFKYSKEKRSSKYCCFALLFSCVKWPDSENKTWKAPKCMLVAARYMQSTEQRGKCVNCLVSAGFWRAKGRPAGSLEVTVLVRSRLIVNASVCTNSGDNTMAQIAMASQVQRNSQRGVGTACQSGVGSHSQGCHWRKRLESCAEIERDKDTREREEEEARRMKERDK